MRYNDSAIDIDRDFSGGVDDTTTDLGGGTVMKDLIKN